MSLTHIRPAVTADFAVMDQLCTAAVRRECAQVYDAEQIEAWVGAPNPGRFEAGVAQGVRYYVTERRGRIVAYGGIDLGRGEIKALFVDPAFGDDGLGEEMLGFMLREAKAGKVGAVQVDSLLNAASFYHRHGFRSVAPQVLDLEHGLQLEAVLMRREVGA